MVGAGVSGCACAATLAASGVRVTLVNSALDTVGQPGYGPVVIAGDGGWDSIADTLAALPSPLRGAWLHASVAAGLEAPFFFVDRRALGIETKRALERVPGLELRQGVVTDIRSEPADAPAVDGEGGGWPRVVVGTVFGETMEADAVVLAVGLSLGGRVRVGDDVLPGGRYGETSADGLCNALEALGVAFCENVVEVGSRFSKRSFEGWDVDGEIPTAMRELAGDCRRRVSWTLPLREILAEVHRGPGRLEGYGSASSPEGAPAWPSDYPPAPHWTDELRSRAAVLAEGTEGVAAPWVSPDGAATGEMHLSPEGTWGTHGQGDDGEAIDEIGGDVLGVKEGAMASRLSHSVTGLVITNVGPAGRLLLKTHPTPGIWVTGRAGGAVDYLGSLASGVRVARDVAVALEGVAVRGISSERRAT